jgi:hypothetical protein
MTFATERDLRHSERGRRLALAVVVVALAMPGAIAAQAQPAPSAPRTWHAQITALAGAVQLDGRLADYQWDVNPRGAWGAEATVGRSRLAGGVRVWSSTTRQSLDPTVASASPLVHSTSLELVLRGDMLERWGGRLVATASGGWLHLGYDPDRLVIDGGGVPVTVDLAPIDTGVMGGGLGVERSLGARWLAGVELDHRFFDLDAAHQSGGSTVLRRERFGDWNARFRIGWAVR